jgi:hypothetical protein
LYLLDIENFPPKKSGIFSKKRKIEKKIPKKKLETLFFGKTPKLIFFSSLKN